MASRREFLITGASALAFSGAIFHATQGFWNDVRQYAGTGLKRPLDGPLAPPKATALDPVAHAINRFTFGPGPGDHARASASFLTGCQARKTKGADIKVGVSVDQIAADKVVKSTRLPSLELSCDDTRSAGNGSYSRRAQIPRPALRARVSAAR